MVDALVLGGNGGNAVEDVTGFEKISEVVTGFILLPCAPVAMLRIPGVERFSILLPNEELVGKVAGVKFKRDLDTELVPLNPRGVSVSFSLPFSSLGKSSNSKLESSIPRGVCVVVGLVRPEQVAELFKFCLV